MNNSKEVQVNSIKNPRASLNACFNSQTVYVGDISELFKPIRAFYRDKRRMIALNQRAAGKIGFFKSFNKAVKAVIDGEESAAASTKN